jgi:hypothetical protein
VYDLGKLAGEVNQVRADAAQRGRGPTVEFSVWGHASLDGPRGDLPNSGPYALDQKQMTLEGWSKIDFGWKQGGSFAAFFGCRATFGKGFLGAQEKKGLGKAGYFDTWSYPSLHPSKYVRRTDIGGVDWHVDYVATMLRSGKWSPSKQGLWYVGIDKWDHRRNTLYGASVTVHPMVWVTSSLPKPVPVPPVPVPVPEPVPDPVPIPKPVPPVKTRPKARPVPTRAPSSASYNCQFGPGSPDPRGHTSPGFRR